MGLKKAVLLSGPEINLPYYVPHMRNFEGLKGRVGKS